VLLFAAARENRHRYRLRVVEVSEIVDSAFAGIADLVEAARFVIDRKIAEGLPPVMGDVAALSQCLQNLITNALKYGTRERWIGIEASLEADEEAKSPEIQIRVSDRGMGIDPADLSRIFEPFYRSPSATAAAAQASGCRWRRISPKRCTDG
jgi:signal transduction histidine kinase